MVDAEILAYYSRGLERDRLASGRQRIEFLRIWDLLERCLPAAPATVVDVGGGAGVYAIPLASAGYEVHLVDPVPLHVEQAAAAARQAEILAAVGQSLAARPYEERQAILAHMTPHLAGQGVAPGAVAEFDPTDANLASAVGQAVILRGMLVPPSSPDGQTPPGPEPTTG